MQENERERTRNTNSVDSSFTSIAWVVEAIDRTLVYWVFWLQIGNEDRIKFIWKKNDNKKNKKTNQDENVKKGRRRQQEDIEEILRFFFLSLIIVAFSKIE